MNISTLQNKFFKNNQYWIKQPSLVDTTRISFWNLFSTNLFLEWESRDCATFRTNTPLCSWLIVFAVNRGHENDKLLFIDKNNVRRALIFIQ